VETAARKVGDLAQAILLEATTLSVTVDAALRVLNDCIAGYPSQVPGAAALEAGPLVECRHEDCTEFQPCPVHDGPPVVLTQPERGADSHDAAAADLEQLIVRVKRVARDVRVAAAIASRWGRGGVDGSTVRSQLADALSNLWCVNCAEHGFDTRRSHGDYCEFCSGIKSKYKRYPNLQLLEWHKMGRRVLPSDVARAFKTTKHTTPSVDEGSPDQARQRRAKRIRE
jgi:hypothetical protein